MTRQGIYCGIKLSDAPTDENNDYSTWDAIALIFTYGGNTIQFVNFMLASSNRMYCRIRYYGTWRKWNLLGSN